MSASPDIVFARDFLAMLPESYLLGAPKAVFDNPVGHGSSLSEEILEDATVWKPATPSSASELPVTCVRHGYHDVSRGLR
jgi:hypothetical protein